MNDVQLRLTQLQQAVAAGGEYFSPAVTARAQEDLRLAQHRMEVGDGFVVAALIGGTGSGKSTIFNRLTTFDFAQVSEQRPTTREIMACTWGGDSSQLLDVLEVPPRNRIQHESLLTQGNEHHDALVLLDTPDYDSVDMRNSGKVARLVPLVDVVLWVLDPQKYADAQVYQELVTLGRRYQRVTGESRNEHTMLVVVNRIDTVAPAEREQVLADIRATIDRLGFADVRILATSALYGEGIDQLDEALSAITADRTLWQATAQAQLDTVADALISQIGQSEADLPGAYLDELTQTVVRATGTPAVVAAIRDAHGPVTVQPTAPAATLSVALRDMWVTYAIAGLPVAWQAGVEQEVPPATHIRKRIGKALASVPVPQVPRRRARGWYAGAVVLMVLGALLGGLSVAGPQWWQRLVPILAGAVVGLVVLLIGVRRARARQAQQAQQAAQAYETAVRTAVHEALTAVLVPGVQGVIKRHRAARTLLSGSQR